MAELQFERKPYIDNLRTFCILLLFFYHTAMIYNTWGEPFYVQQAGNPIIAGFVQITYSWYMPLLFILAGISASFALNKRTSKQFAKERCTKLLIPLIFGILLLVPIQTFFAEKFHNGYDGNYFYQYVLFFTKPTDLSGASGGFTFAQLWFVLYLFVISLVSLPLMVWYKKREKKLPTDNNLFTWLMLGFAPLLIFVFGLVPDIGGKNIVQYLIIFLLGFFILSEDSVLRKIEKMRFVLFPLFVIFTVLNLLMQNLWNVDNGVLYDLFSSVLTWIGCLSLIGLSKKSLNFSNKATKYLATASFPIYIFHQSFIIMFAYYANLITGDVALQVIFTISLSVVATFITYEIFRRCPVTRFMFGIKSPKKAVIKKDVAEKNVSVEDKFVEDVFSEDISEKDAGSSS